MTPPTFAVVITAFNERDLVGWSIRSVLAQTRGDWELVIVDDGSTDGTSEVVRPYTKSDPRIRLLVKENEGLSAARNDAIAATEAPLVSFLDADDMWLPPYLESMAMALEQEPPAGIAYTDAWALDVVKGRFRKGTAMGRYQPEHLPADPTEVMKLLVRQNFIWVSATVRRPAIEEAGLFRPEFRMTEDIELWFRVLSLGYRVVRAPGGVLGIKRQRPEALSRQSLPMIVNLQRVMALVRENDAIPPSVRELAAQRVDQLEQERRVLSREDRLRWLAQAMRLRLGSIKRAFTPPWEWMPEPPAEVREAFPDLRPPES